MEIRLVGGSNELKDLFFSMMAIIARREIFSRPVV